MKRREVIRLISGAAVVPVLAPIAARAQPPVIGFLNQISREEYASTLKAFHEGLREQGFVEGQNVAVEYRWAESQYERLPVLANELVRRGVAVIVASGGDPTALAAQAATRTIPIVFASSRDPVEIGLVANLARPGGNLTGVSLLSVELNLKRLELLLDVAPDASTIGLLVNPVAPTTEVVINEVSLAARSHGRQVKAFNANSERDIAQVMASLKASGVGSLLITNSALFNAHSDLFGTLALRHAIPAIHQLREFAQAGGLMSYGAGVRDAYRIVGNYTGRILKGEKPADLPVQQQTKIELVVNLKSANALGVIVPTSILVRADEVIE